MSLSNNISICNDPSSGSSIKIIPESQRQPLTECIDHSLVQDYLDTGSKLNLKLVLEDVTITAYPVENRFEVQVESNCASYGEPVVLRNEQYNYYEEVMRTFYSWSYEFLNLQITKCRLDENKKEDYNKSKDEDDLPF